MVSISYVWIAGEKTVADLFRRRNGSEIEGRENENNGGMSHAGEAESSWRSVTLTGERRLKFCVSLEKFT